MEWRGTHALSLTLQLAQFQNVMLFVHQMKMFLPLIIKAHCCIDIVTRRLFFYIQILSVLALPMPFPILKILLHNHCHM